MERISVASEEKQRKAEKISRTIAKPSDCHFEKMTLGDLSKSPNFSKNALAIRGRFWYLATFPLWRASRLQDPSENAHLRSKV